jgi:hypothetical protein
MARVEGQHASERARGLVGIAGFEGAPRLGSRGVEVGHRALRLLEHLARKLAPRPE